MTIIAYKLLIFYFCNSKNILSLAKHSCCGFMPGKGVTSQISKQWYLYLG